MSEASSYPPIDPTNFDLIIVGTGFPESIIAAAASASGKSVLHLDPNSFYGSHYASLSLDELTNFLNSSSVPSPSPPPPPPIPEPAASEDDAVIELIPCPLYTDVEISSYPHGDEINLLDQGRKFNLDLGAPRALFCADKSVDLLLKSGASQYVEFKSIDASFVLDGNGNLVNVPDSRAAIFKDKSLGLVEKNQLMRFFKLVEQHLTASSDANGSNDGLKISEEDLESPFVDFLEKMRLPPKIKSIIVYAIAMVDYDQNDKEASKVLLKTKDGIDRLALYNSSIGRFSNAVGALIYPIYGEGELPQAFCRRAAVKGCLYVLRMPVLALLMDKSMGHYKGVRLASGQNLYSQQLLLDPLFTVPSSLPSSPPDFLSQSTQTLSIRDCEGMVARGICITASPLKPDVSTCLVVYPPRTLCTEQTTSIRALQLGANLAICPSGFHVLYFSTLCDDAGEGRKLLCAAMNAILKIPVSCDPDNISKDPNESTDGKPVVLWRAFYIQKQYACQYETISSSPTPSGSLNYTDILDATVKLFHHLYPHEEFFPDTISTDSTDDPEQDSGLTPES